MNCSKCGRFMEWANEGWICRNHEIYVWKERKDERK